MVRPDSRDEASSVRRAKRRVAILASSGGNPGPSGGARTRPRLRLDKSGKAFAMKPSNVDSAIRGLCCRAGGHDPCSCRFSSDQCDAANSQTPPASNATPCSSQIDIASYLPGGANEDPDVRAVNRFIDETFAAALAQLPTASSLDLYHQIGLLGTLGLYDKNLSVNENVACTSCHFQAAGFTGGVSLFNETIVAQPGSVPITNAKPPGRITELVHENHKATVMRHLRRYSSTTQPSRISMAETSGYAGNGNPLWKTPQRSRRRDLPSTR